MKPSLGWVDVKTACIDWDEVDAGRTFVWIEDGILPEERRVLQGRGIEPWYYHTDVLADEDALLKTLEKLKAREEVTA